MIATLKVGLSPSKKVFFVCFNDSPSKIMKNAFYFIIKALFVLIIFKFFPWLFGHEEKTAWLERQVNFDIYDVTAWLTKNYNTHYLISHELKATRQWNLVS